MIRTGWGIVKGEEVMTAIEIIDEMSCKPLNLLVYLGRTFLSDKAACQSRLISEATYPAPKPLSILTTVTFEAHEFIMPSRAAIPWKAAP